MGNEKRKILTLCIVHKHPKVLLGMKKRGFGEGRWNGFGGKVKEGEGILEAAKRELMEETALESSDIKRLGALDFQWQGKTEILEVNIFKVCRFSGEPQETEEMRPCWFDVGKIPFDKMWPDDKYWFPLFLADKNFKGKFIFDENDNIIEKKLLEI